MSLNFQQVRQQVNAMGESAPQRIRILREKRAEAMEALRDFASDLTTLREKVGAAVSYNTNLRCAVPAVESLDYRGTNPAMPETMTLLAADGSQINPDRHASVNYCLVNVGAIQMVHGMPNPPVMKVQSKLIFDEQMYTAAGRITERMVALMRDLGERVLLADMAKDLDPPTITLTDGPLELWVGRDGDSDARAFEDRFKDYLGALWRLHQCGASTAGYIDQPQGDLFIRLLEIAKLPHDKIDQAGWDYRPFLGVTDADLFEYILEPGERSAVFGIQSRNADKYPYELALHFFYLNVGRDADHAYPVRVEIPAWVARNVEMINNLHAVLIQQCRILGTRTYPYIIHRSHEVAVVTLDEKRQVERMIALEMYNRGLRTGESSHKQAAKDLPSRRRM